MNRSGYTELKPLPTTEELMLRLIGEDLKSYRFFDVLRSLGLEDDFYQAELGHLILNYARLSPENDAVTDLYYGLLSIHSLRLLPTRESLAAEAKIIYVSLMEFARLSTE